ncbi:sulfurtransferase [Bacillus sp. 31A1R]|uniref:Sulfurtransferase n=1 Tax=Robertmurraya mangrovi TaxID=3098077 RepID=A0ABU5J1C9_9BACI|nr:sulfurtransferase [Bacillus sp. 31A1R]MDZ5473186.1 sulfurtransferase [Bacillus sp. 31A1R]
MKTFISNEWLLEHLEDEEVRVVDCRFKLGNPNEGSSLFQTSHLPGAIYFDLEKDLSSVVREHGGRHPLPKLEQFKCLLEKSGISNSTTVVAYDGGEGAFASRLWWLLKYVGHEKVFILDGGFRSWEQSSFPVTNNIVQYNQAEYILDIQKDMLASYLDVKQAVESKDAILIDSRETKRYMGVEELIDKKAGHIPGAHNYVWLEGFQNGHFKEPYEQANRFHNLDKSKEVIVYCGSGVTATPNVIALKDAGFTKVKLYAGSFSDWISYEENEVATKN